MEVKRTARLALVIILTICLIIPTSLVPEKAYGTVFTDVAGHWAESYITTAVNKGIVKGYQNGSFKPDNAVTRAEFAVMINKALGNAGTQNISFNDVSYSDWYYNDVSKAVAAVYVAGYDDGTFKPNNLITRQEAAVMISRIVPSYGIYGNLNSYGDVNTIAQWAYTAMKKVNGKGYIGAYSDGKLHPDDKLTRAQTAKIICDIISKENIITSNPVVKTKDTLLSGKIYSNGVTIHKDLGENNASIDNCVILGTLSVQGGGINSVSAVNSRIANCSVSKTGSPVRVIAKGETYINNAEVSNSATLETSNLTGSDFGKGFNLINARGSSELTLAGSFTTVKLTGSGANVRLRLGTILALDVDTAARNSNITVEDNGNITTINVNAAAAFHGKGRISTMNANVNDVTYEQKPSNVRLGNGVSRNPQLVDAILGITFDPVDGATKVPIDKKITITFSQAMTKKDGKSISNSDVRDIILLTKDKSNGTIVDFDGTISSNDKVMTITPRTTLATDTKYYVTIPKDKFKDENGDANVVTIVYFITGDGSVDGVTFNPVNNSTGVKVNVDPTITFDDAIETYAGDSITSKYLYNNIDFRKSSSNGSKVSFTASINSRNKVITIDPADNLVVGQKYYIGFDSKVFRTDNDRTNITAKSIVFTVANNAPTMTFSPVNNATNIENNINMTVSFSEKIYNNSGSEPNSSYIISNVTLRDITTNQNVSYSPSFYNYSSGGRITLDPTYSLQEGHRYTITVNSNRFRNSASVYSGSESSTFTVKNVAMDLSGLNVAISNADTSKNGIVVNTLVENVLVGKQWVTQEEMDELNVKYNAAVAARNSTSQTTINDSALALNTAIINFNSVKKNGTKVVVDKSALSSTISAANDAKSGVLISTDGTNIEKTEKWVTQDEMNALTSAINGANTIYNNTNTTQEEVNSANSTLSSAKDTFIGFIKDGTKLDPVSEQQPDQDPVVPDGTGESDGTGGQS